MKKTKLALISMTVFITVFYLTVIIDTPFSLIKGHPANNSKTATTKFDSLAKDTKGAQIQSFSIEISQIPYTSQDYVSGNQSNMTTDTINQTGTQGPADSASNPTVTAEAAPTAAPMDTAQSKGVKTPEPKKSKYADIGISAAKDFVNLREKASTESSVLGKLYKGSAARIIKKKGNWYYVESGSVKGYIKSEFLKTGIPDKELINKYGTLSISVEVDGLNVRKKPSTDSKRVTVIYKDETYPVLKTKGAWFKIKVPDEKASGYVKKEYAEVLVKFKEAVSKEEEEMLKQLEAEERAKKETEIKYQGGQDYNVSELELLACLIHAEAGSQSYEGKLAVANVVLNRVRSSKYPDSIRAVIYQPGQFSVARSGSLQKQLDSYSNYASNAQLMSIKAAKDALAGANNIGSRLYFHTYSAAVRKGYDKKETSVKIENLLFW